jgi:hypothetical protein
MKTYEIEVEMTVRRTIRVKAPDPDMARAVARGFLEAATDGPGELSSVLKWTDGRAAYRPMPVETILFHQLTSADPVEVGAEA